ncbi:hypothetical protein BO71DRAFT_146895 [Aspergillus ellipticus CBS 707.79]|uniref:Uncharacterized protein n=1 Tax=Aspergillus ellipticus CBS 707.79 TaxID=1448320 RepID=A0A319D0V1_9EURO|nr:hypothetical protein BO71DRAFT_146895 [Aspergillus ellipticus CBS 707.79]
MQAGAKSRALTAGWGGAVSGHPASPTLATLNYSFARSLPRRPFDRSLPLATPIRMAWKQELTCHSLAFHFHSICTYLTYTVKGRLPQTTYISKQGHTATAWGIPYPRGIQRKPEMPEGTRVP